MLSDIEISKSAPMLKINKIAEKLNVSESYVTRLINGERYNKNFEIFIAMELGFNYRNLR